MQARCHGGHFGAVTPKREICLPQASKNCAPKESNRTNIIGVQKSSPRNVRAKSVPKEVFVPPSESASPSKNLAQKKATGTMPLGCIFKEDFCSFFSGLSPECEGKIRVKGGFCVTKTKIVPKKKAAGPTPRRCSCDKDFFFGLHPPIFFAPHFLFSLLPSTLLWRQVSIHE